MRSRTAPSPAHPAGAGLPCPGAAGGRTAVRVSALQGCWARLCYLQLVSGSWYTDRRSASSCGTPWCPPTGAASTVPTARFLPPTAAAGPCGPAREMPEESWSWRRGPCGDSGTGRSKLLEKFSDRTSNDCLLRHRVERDTADRCGTSARRTASPASASIRTPNAGIRRGNFWPWCWALPTWTTPG